MWTTFQQKTKPEMHTGKDIPPHGGFYRNSHDNYRNLLAPEEVLEPQHVPRILLIDDDPIFGKTMRRAAKFKGCPMTCCGSIAEFSDLKSWDYDVVIMDYDLGEVNGYELTNYIEQFAKEETPVVLISQTEQKNSLKWPSTIREFVHKRVGPFAILDAAFEAHEVNLIMKLLVKKP